MHRSRGVVALAATLAVLGALMLTGTPASAAGGGSETLGEFLAAFSPGGEFNATPPANVEQSMRYPTAVSIAALPNGKFVYWNGLEDLENDTYPLATDATRMDPRSRSRQMTINPNTWQVPTPEDGGDEDMFCADLRILLNGDVIVAGGTRWRFDPVNLAELTGGAVTEPGGTAELFGSNAVRFFTSAPGGGTWTQTPNMNMANGRWYPAMLTLPDGRLLIAGGVGRLLYNTSGINVRPLEIFDPYTDDGTYSPATGTWTTQGGTAEQTHPLFPRFHLTAGGKVFYDGVGQMWGPFGQATDQALWNIMKSYDPATRAWADKGVGNFGALSGAVSVMLPFRANENHNTTRILHGGGVLGTSPGTFLATNLSELITIAPDESVTASQLSDTVNRRWYSSGLIGADGNVFVFNGADKDEVIMPGSETAVRQAEMFDVKNYRWVGLATGNRDRTYHNSAILLRDGSVMIGGHSPLNTGYGSGHNEAPDGTTIYTSNDYHNATKDTPIAGANNLKDPSFEIFKPPYLFKGTRPVITSAPSDLMWGSTVTIGTPDAATVDDAFLVHMPSTTHTTDADMRALEVPIVARGSGTVSITVPSNRAAATPGYYYLFLRRTNTNQGFSEPTVSEQAAIVRVGNATVFGGSSSQIAPVEINPVHGKAAPAAEATKTVALGSAVVEQASAVRTGGTRPRNTQEGAFAVAAAALLVAAGSLWRFRRKERAPA